MQEFDKLNQMDNYEKPSDKSGKLSLDNIEKLQSLGNMHNECLTELPTNEDKGIVNSDVISLSSVKPPHNSQSDCCRHDISSEGSNTKSTCMEACKALQPRVGGHSRSQSDGCQNIQRDATHWHSLHTQELHTCPPHSTPLGGSLARSLNKLKDVSNSYDHIMGEVSLPSSLIDYSSSASFTERDDTSKLENHSLFGSRFPRPKPGESLISFLSSADHYKKCGALERENAHFYISEALMAAFEKMRFEAECRDAGLMSDFDDDSDEEISNLQKEIRRKRLEKLDRLQYKDVKNSASNSSNSAVGNLPSASTTDYSLYESPRSSTHTESSDPELTPSHEQGVRLMSKNTSTLGRPRRKTLKRSRTRTERLGGSSILSSSGCSGLCDTSTYESSTNDTIDTIDLVTSTHQMPISKKTSDSASQTSNDGSSDNKTLMGPEDASDDHFITGNENYLSKDKESETQADDQTSFSNKSSRITRRNNDSSSSYLLEPIGYGFVSPNTSINKDELPPHIPHHRTAEGIGLHLLQHLGSPQRQLPKASDLQWLVSERDAPQELLPLPDGPLGVKDQVLLRGTSDWAPPREQLILSQLKKLSRSRTMSNQKYRCAGCGQHVSPSLSKHYRLCHYFMRYFCATCHMNQTHVIPAKMLHEWDGKAYPVSCFAHQFLTRLAPEPLLYPSTINPSLYSTSPPLQQFRLYRVQLLYCLPYIYSCSRAARSFCPDHWRSDGEVVSLQELLNIKTHAGAVVGTSKSPLTPGGSVLLALQYITAKCLDHVSNCQACQGRGFICEVCQDETPIFPFELSTVRVCRDCSACSHYRCPLRRCTRCDLRRHKRTRSYEAKEPHKARSYEAKEPHKARSHEAKEPQKARNCDTRAPQEPPTDVGASKEGQSVAGKTFSHHPDEGSCTEVDGNAPDPTTNRDTRVEVSEERRAGSEDVSTADASTISANSTISSVVGCQGCCSLKLESKFNASSCLSLTCMQEAATVAAAALTDTDVTAGRAVHCNNTATATSHRCKGLASHNCDASSQISTKNCVIHVGADQSPGVKNVNFVAETHVMAPRASDTDDSLGNNTSQSDDRGSYQSVGSGILKGVGTLRPFVSLQGSLYPSERPKRRVLLNNLSFREA
ncbi:uncharacterized protein LOC108668236 isoform X2 [Hyalella azteca]|uniref:Uncharacterized protein LOC108668236 isoform X2 n=1 Tax=Hyalella azteca TaxID=294128 RepID=A0A979FH20_HYAAZ|nr:uncharacterized protein LOC108668236 isoform X2 [Hyalella azteca]